MTLRPGEHVRSFCAEITDNMFKKTYLTRVDEDAASYATIKSGLITSAKEYFCKRFSNFQEDPVLRGAADLSNPLLWPRERQDLFIFISLITRMRYKRDIKMGRLCTPGGAVFGIVGGGVTFRFF